MMWMGLKREKQPYFYIAMGWIGLRYIQTRINYEHGERNDAPTTDLNCLPWSHTRWECVDPDFDITI